MFATVILPIAVIVLAVILVIGLTICFLNLGKKSDKPPVDQNDGRGD